MHPQCRRRLRPGRGYAHAVMLDLNSERGQILAHELGPRARFAPGSATDVLSLLSDCPAHAKMKAVFTYICR